MRRLHPAAAAFAALFLLAGPARAWVSNGTPVCTAPGVQQTLSGCADGAGGVYLVWLDPRSGAFNIYAQHLFSDGSVAPGWPVNGVPLTASGGALAAFAMPDGAGGLLVIGQRSTSIVAQRVTAAGTLAPGFPADGKVVTSDLQARLFAASSDGVGGAYIERVRNTPSIVPGQVTLTRVGPDGAIAAGWSLNGVLLVTGSNTLFSGLRVEPNPGGGAIATVLSTMAVPGGANDGFVARVRANGTLAQTTSTPPYLSNHNPPGVGPAIATGDGANGIFATWHDWDGGLDFTGAHWDSGGAQSWPVPTYFPGDAVPVADGAGGVYVSGRSNQTFQILTQRRLGNGSTVPGWPLAGVAYSGNQAFNGTSFRNTAAGLLACWSERLGTEYDIRAFLVAPNGTAAPGWAFGGNPVCTVAGNQTLPLLVPDGVGGVIAAWIDQRDDATTGQDIYAARLLDGGPVAARASLVSAVAETGVIRLDWWSPDGAAFAATVERQSRGAGYGALAELRADGGGHLRWEDRDVAPGETYDYRLVVLENGERTVLGEVSLAVPRQPEFALEPARPNPSAGPITIACALPSAAPARLEVLDVGGRRVLAHELAGTAGRQVLRLDEDLPPGLYLVRLTQGGRVATGRVVRMER